MARLSLPPLAQGPAEGHHSGIREIANEALRTPGAIRLDVGQPNFRTPDHIGAAGKRARVNGIHVTPDRIACTPGGVGAVAAVFASVLENGDEVLLPDPGWPNFRMMLSWTDAKGVFYPCRPGDGFQPDLDALARLITSHTKLIVVNSPNNPTGAIYPRKTIEKLVELAQRHNLWMISDECYDQIVLDGTWT